MNILHICSIDVYFFLHKVTHWHDGSAIYGSTQAQADLLRERKGGRMKTFSYQNRQLLPLDWNNKDCIGFSKGLRCFLSGEKFKYFYLWISCDAGLYLQVIPELISWSDWLLCKLFGIENTIEWLESCLALTQSGMMKGSSKRPAELSVLKCNTSLTTNIFLFWWVRDFSSILH